MVMSQIASSHFTFHHAFENSASDGLSISVKSVQVQGKDTHYFGYAIQLGCKWFFHARNVLLEITESEHNLLVANPKLYYFSTALKLHLRTDRVLQGKPDNDGAESLRSA
jgi:hypothetical protein